MEMNTDNLQITPTKVKGPFVCLSQAITAGKADEHCQNTGTLTIIKCRNTGMYDYVPGSDPVLFPFDLVIYRYHYLGHRVWSYPTTPEGRVVR